MSICPYLVVGFFPEPEAPKATESEEGQTIRPKAVHKESHVNITNEKDKHNVKRHGSNATKRDAGKRTLKNFPQTLQE